MLLGRAIPERLNAFSDGVFAVLTQYWYWNCGRRARRRLAHFCCYGQMAELCSPLPFYRHRVDPITITFCGRPALSAPESTPLLKTQIDRPNTGRSICCELICYFSRFPSGFDELMTYRRAQWQ